MERKKYAAEFKREAVRLAGQAGVSRVFVIGRERKSSLVLPRIQSFANFTLELTRFRGHISM